MSSYCARFHPVVMADTGRPNLPRFWRGLQHHFIDIAPGPVFSSLEALDQGMAGASEVLSRVLRRGRVAAAHVPAGETQPQVDPPAPGFQALFAPLRCVGLDRPNLIEMGTVHGSITPEAVRVTCGPN